MLDVLMPGEMEYNTEKLLTTGASVGIRVSALMPVVSTNLLVGTTAASPKVRRVKAQRSLQYMVEVGVLN